MVRGLYTAASGALVAQAQVDTIANNLANVDTAGFKRALLQVQAQPERELYRFQTDPAPNGAAASRGVATADPIGALGSGAEVYDTPNVFSQGPVAHTGNDLDVALMGAGFFAVRAGNGALGYTRDGAFVRDAQGYLTAQNGDRVLDATGQPIVLPPQGKVGIARDGSITVDNVPQTQLAIVQFANPSALRAQGAERYVDTGNARPRAAAGTVAIQGALEKSNADVVRSMVDLIAAERWFDANTKVIQTEDAATGTAVQTVGRTQ